MGKIQWLDWSKESFEKARAEGKPILLDIKGSWCHWCHVMDETSYSDPSIIDALNKKFVPIRVDTDKRPDVNRRYNMGYGPLPLSWTARERSSQAAPTSHLNSCAKSSDQYSKCTQRARGRFEASLNLLGFQRRPLTL